MDKHDSKLASITEEIESLRSILPDERSMKVVIGSSSLHKGKILIKAEGINFSFGERTLWKNPLSFIIRSGDRFLIKGNNGSGKTTLLKIINGLLKPITGQIERADFSYLYVDQNYSLIRNELTVYEQAQLYNNRHFPEHDIKMMLSKYLFFVDAWDQYCHQLSGGEKMRLLFCCLMISNQTPDLFILDEPTNNLDISSVEIITNVIRDYQGTLLIVSHDQYFLDEIGIEKSIDCSAE